MKTILIIKTSALGDITHIYPSVRFLKDAYPGCRIDWVVERSGESLVKSNPYVDCTLVIDSKAWRKSLFANETWTQIRAFFKRLRETRYDVVFDFQGNSKSGVITALAHAQTKVGFGKQAVSESLNCLFTNVHVDPKEGQNIRYDYLALVERWSGLKAGDLKQTLLNLTSDEQSLLKSLLLKKSTHSNIMVCPGSAWPNKQLTGQTLLAFLQRIEKTKAVKFWLVYGTPAEKQLVEDLHHQLNDAEIVPKLTLPLLQNWMCSMDQVIAMDSLALHLAGEAQVSTFSVFGPSLASKYEPLGLQHIALQGNCPYGRHFKKRCPVLRTCPTGACMHDLPVHLICDSYISSQK